MSRDITVGDLVRYRPPSTTAFDFDRVGQVVADAGEAEYGPDKGHRFFWVRFRRAPRFANGPRCRPVLLCIERELWLEEPLSRALAPA